MLHHVPKYCSSTHKHSYTIIYNLSVPRSIYFFYIHVLYMVQFDFLLWCSRVARVATHYPPYKLFHVSSWLVRVQYIRGYVATQASSPACVGGLLLLIFPRVYDTWCYTFYMRVCKVGLYISMIMERRKKHIPRSYVCGVCLCNTTCYNPISLVLVGIVCVVWPKNIYLSAICMCVCVYQITVCSHIFLKYVETSMCKSIFSLCFVAKKKINK